MFDERANVCFCFKGNYIPINHLIKGKLPNEFKMKIETKKIFKKMHK